MNEHNLHPGKQVTANHAFSASPSVQVQRVYSSSAVLGLLAEPRQPQLLPLPTEAAQSLIHPTAAHAPPASKALASQSLSAMRPHSVPDSRYLLHHPAPMHSDVRGLREFRADS